MRGMVAQFMLPVAVLAIAAAIGGLAGDVGTGLVVGIPLSGLTAFGLGLRARALLRRVEDVARGRCGAAVDAARLTPGDAIGAALRASVEAAAANARATTALQRQLDQQALVLDRMNDGLMRIDADLSVSWSNVAAGTILGGRNPTGRSFVSVTRDHELRAAAQRCLATGAEQQHTLEIAGEGRLLSVVVIRIAEHPAEALVMLRDITEVSRLQNLRREFVANVSHELRTPLSTIKILTESLLDLREDDDEATGYLWNINAEVDLMTALVRDLLTLTRLETSGGQLTVRQIDAVQLVHDVTDRMRPLAERHGVALALEVDDASVTFEGDERRLHQALINLVTNAIAHTPSGGSVTIAARALGGAIEFTVRDTGTGIAALDLPRVWERFYKTDRARTGAGTGLGLAIVKHIALAHQGGVSATSELGSGSTFTVWIPMGIASGGRKPAAGEARAAFE